MNDKLARQELARPFKLGRAWHFRCAKADERRDASELAERASFEFSLRQSSRVRLICRRPSKLDGREKERERASERERRRGCKRLLARALSSGASLETGARDEQGCARPMNGPELVHRRAPMGDEEGDGRGGNENENANASGREQEKRVARGGGAFFPLAVRQGHSCRRRRRRLAATN